jgi:hypothetical protein
MLFEGIAETLERLGVERKKRRKNTSTSRLEDCTKK